MERSKETVFKYTAKNNHLVCRVQQCRTRVSMQLLPCCWRVVPVSDQTQRRHLHSIPKADTTHTKVMLTERCCHTRESVCVAATTGTKCNSSTGRMQKKTANLQTSNDRSSLRWRFASNDPPPASAVKSIACYRSRVRRKMLPCCRSPVMSSVAVPCEDFAPRSETDTRPFARLTDDRFVFTYRLPFTCSGLFRWDLRCLKDLYNNRLTVGFFSIEA